MHISMPNIALGRPPTTARFEQLLGGFAAAYPGGLPEALHHYRDEIAAEQARLRAAASEARWTDASRAADNLGSLGALAGLDELHCTARAAERLLMTGDTAALTPILQSTDLAVSRACEALTAPLE
jgi:hypothetical protein